ncbi:MAG: hypothetical protein WKF59_23615 [Chitinophagaceae bacterium]
MVKREFSHYYITDYATNKPVVTTELTVTVSGNPNIKLTMHKIDSGVYEIKGIFPEKKKYNISVNLNSSLGADLLLIKDIETGKELVQEEVAEEHGHWYSSNLFYAGLGLLAGIIVMYFLMKRTNKRVAAVGIIALLLFPTATTNYTAAHGGDDHAVKKVAMPPVRLNHFLLKRKLNFFLIYLRKRLVQEILINLLKCLVPLCLRLRAWR